MNGSDEQIVFCINDVVALKDDPAVVGCVDRSFGHVESHEPRPQRDYDVPIQCHPEILRADFDKFMKTGVPPRGSVLVQRCFQLLVQLIPESKLVLLDRSIYVGDVVKRRAKDPMSGIAIGTRAVCTLRPSAPVLSSQSTTQDDACIRNVPMEELTHAHEFAEDFLVIYGDWVGRIEHVFDEVAIRLSNNSVVVVEDPEELVNEDFSVGRLSVGERVSTKKGNLRRGRWKFGAFDPNVRPVGTVVETRTVWFDVQWLAKNIATGAHPDRNMPEPSPRLIPDELENEPFYVYGHSAKSFDAERPQYADFSTTCPVRFKDVAGAAVKYDGSGSAQLHGKFSRIPRQETLGYDMNVFRIRDTCSHITVQWQDLTITEEPSTSLIPDPTIKDEDEVWPGEIVCTKQNSFRRDPAMPWATQPDQVGIVQAVRPRDRMATVRWFKEPNVKLLEGEVIPPCETGELLDTSENISLYDIRSTPSLSRRRNDFVLLHPDAMKAKPAINLGGIDWFGEVVDLGLDGKITVRLGAAKPVLDIRVSYDQVTLAYSSDMDSSYPDDYSDMSEDEVGEDVQSDFDSEFNEMWIEYEGMDGMDPEELGDEDEWSTEDESDEDDSMPDLEPIPEDGVETSKTTPEKETQQQASRTPVSLPGRSSTTTQERSAFIPSSIPGNADVPAPFAILESLPPSDHHFIRSAPSTTPAFMKKIAKEHKILRTSLPPFIFVRTWESRLDLIRVLMIGPEGTPYEYAPFFFDFHLDSSWPTSPPQAFFHSWTRGNGPVNPNLYEDGKICLSLLGTWHADERGESWNSKSTLLQVLVSIHSLVLVKEPYYNEAGYDIHRESPETKLDSALYSERAYFLSRAFIYHAHPGKISSFEGELNYLYYDQSRGAPQLLTKALNTIAEVINRTVDRSDKEEPDGLHKVSLGALVMLRRESDNLVALQALKYREGVLV